MSPHTERYEHFGEVRYFVKDLGAGRRSTDWRCLGETDDVSYTRALIAAV